MYLDVKVKFDVDFQTALIVALVFLALGIGLFDYCQLLFGTEFGELGGCDVGRFLLTQRGRKVVAIVWSDTWSCKFRAGILTPLLLFLPLCLPC